MVFEFRLPDIGEGVVEGEIVKWRVAEGQTIAQDQPMVEVMTDKATVEIPSPRAGKVAKIWVAEGGTCAVGQVMIVIDPDGETVGREGSRERGARDEPDKVQNWAYAHAQAARTGTSVQAVGTGESAQAARTGTSVQAVGTGESARVLATPATRKLARELGIALDSITPTGRGGRVTSDDVRRGIPGDDVRRGIPGAPTALLGETPVPEERVPFRGLRRAIAQNMVRSKFTATHFTYVEEVDVTDLVVLRQQAKAKAAERGIKLSYLPFIVKAVVLGLKKWPTLNSSLDEAREEIVLKKYYHLGIATQGPQGLSVGVLRNADRRSLLDLSREIERVAEAIRTGKATREDLTGSTFTISSLGQLGGVLATPIINYPEAAILGVHKIAEKPAVRGGQIVIRQLMNLSISIDHRIADGYDGASFLSDVKTYLEAPTLMFLDLI